MSSNSMASAQNILTTYAIDLILLDIHIIDGNGISFLETLRAQHHPCEVIIISAANDGNSIRDGFHLGIIDYLIKPFTIQELATSCHLSHVSVRKYIAYLEENNQIDNQQIFTKVGRPYRVYW